MTEDDQVAFTAAFDRWFKGNTAAMKFCADMTEVAHVWDDLVDADKPVSSVKADVAFRKMMLEIPSNEFYRANFTFLHPVIVMIWAQWTAANGVETHPFKGDREKVSVGTASAVPDLASETAETVPPVTNTCPMVRAI